MDPKITKIKSVLNVTNLIDFKLVSNYYKLENWLKKYAPSTAEDYIWRLHRKLATVTGFPKKMLNRYHKLLEDYQKLYPGSDMR